MTSLNISLRALKHPLNLASIGLLLLNDHVLKAAASSPLTGKLSDLAGLFFFPFLLAALLSPLLDRWRVPARRAAGLALGLTCLGFTLVKTWPGANALAVTALEGLLGWPVQIVRDPTDLLALLALWPAWRLWVHLEQAPPLSKQPPGKAAYLALGLASLATLATSCQEQASVERLVVFGQSVYAGDSQSSYYIARSDDGGQSWVEVQSSDAPQQVHQQLENRAELPLTVCDSQDSQICYRITGAEQVQGSQDGGQTWKVAWQLPRGRRDFMERFTGMRAPCAKTLDLTPRDLVLLSQERGTVLIVALGNEGVLVRAIDGTWQRYEVFNATPTPYNSVDPWSLFWLLIPEHILLLGTAFIAWWICSILGAKTVISRLPPHSGHSTRQVIAPLVWGMVFSIFACLGASSSPSLIVLAVIIMFVSPVLTWRRVASTAPRPKMVYAARRASCLGAAGMYPLAWLAFPLWGMGIISLYEIALALCACVWIASFVWSLRRVRRLCLAVTMPVETGPE